MPARYQAIIGGLIIFFAAIGGAFLIGSVYSDTQAMGMVEAMAPSLRTLCFAIITASATVISLLLTTVGFADRVDNEFDRGFYYHIKLIARMCAASLITAVCVLLALTIPMSESETLRSWYSVIYYVLMFASALLAGLIVATIILLYQTMNDIIHVVEPDPEPAE